MKHLKGNGLAEDHSTSNNQTKCSTLSRDRLKGWKKRNVIFLLTLASSETRMSVTEILWISKGDILKKILLFHRPLSVFEPFHSIPTAGKGVLGWKDRFNRGCFAIRSSSLWKHAGSQLAPVCMALAPKRETKELTTCKNEWHLVFHIKILNDFSLVLILKLLYDFRRHGKMQISHMDDFYRVFFKAFLSMVPIYNHSTAALTFCKHIFYVQRRNPF